MSGNNVSNTIPMQFDADLCEEKEKICVKCNLAEVFFANIDDRLARFDETLDDGYCIGVQLHNLENPFQVTRITYKNPDLIIFKGMDHNDNLMEVIQHVSQVCISFVAMPTRPDDAGGRHGFDMSSGLGGGETG